MGIPQFFNWLTRKYNEDIICHFENPDHLFFDFNGIVYQCYARLNYDVLIKKSLHERQNHLIYDVIRYTRHVINTANPSNRFLLLWFDSLPKSATSYRVFR